MKMHFNVILLLPFLIVADVKSYGDEEYYLPTFGLVFGTPHIASFSLGTIYDFNKNRPLSFPFANGIYVFMEPSITSIAAGTGYGISDYFRSLKVYGAFEYCYNSKNQMIKRHKYISANISILYSFVLLKTGILLNLKNINDNIYRISIGAGFG